MKLHICIPSFDMVNADFMMALTSMLTHIYQKRLCDDEDSTLRIVNQRSSLIAQSRETLVESALLAGATHILFLDSDMNFPEDALHRLFSRNEPIVAANYVQRCLPTRPNSITLMGQPLYTDEDSSGLEEVQSVGFGCVLIRAEVFESMPRPWFDTYWFTDDEGNRRMIGEDVYFCHKARHADYKVYVDQDLSHNVIHIGSFEYIHSMARVE